MLMQNAPIIKPLDVDSIEILNDELFQQSVLEVKDRTLLDTARLANLWQLCRCSNPQGAMMEVGSYRGGGALHLSNCCPDRKIYVCDSFLGFEALDEKLDTLFGHHMFLDTTIEEIGAMFKNKGRDYEIVAGFFPSCCIETLSPLSFVHLDVDVYKATKESLEFLAPLMMPRSFIVLDDYRRSTLGVDQAVQEFLACNANWRILPMFPAQGVLFN